MTYDSKEIGEIVAGLSEAQRRGLVEAYTLSGPSGDTFVQRVQDFEALYLDDEHAFVTPHGRLTPLGLAVRSVLQREADR